MVCGHRDMYLHTDEDIQKGGQGQEEKAKGGEGREEEEKGKEKPYKGLMLLVFFSGLRKS